MSTRRDMMVGPPLYMIGFKYDIQIDSCLWIESCINNFFMSLQLSDSSNLKIFTSLRTLEIAITGSLLTVLLWRNWSFFPYVQITYVQAVEFGCDASDILRQLCQQRNALNIRQDTDSHALYINHILTWKGSYMILSTLFCICTAHAQVPS